MSSSALRCERSHVRKSMLRQRPVAVYKRNTASVLALEIAIRAECKSRTSWAFEIAKGKHCDIGVFGTQAMTNHCNSGPVIDTHGRGRGRPLSSRSEYGDTCNSER